MVSGVHGPRQRLHQPGRLLGRQRRTVEFLGQTAAVHELQRKVGMAVVFADLEDLHDVRVLQAGDRFGLGAEAGYLPFAGVFAGQDHLQGHQTVELALPGLVDDAHAAAAQFVQQFVVADVTDFRAQRRADKRRLTGGQRRRLRRSMETRYALFRFRPLRRRRRRKAQRLRQLIDPVVVGEEGFQLARQLRMAGEQLSPVGRAAGVHGLQVRGDEGIDALVAGGGRIEFIGHDITPVFATADAAVAIRV